MPPQPSPGPKSLPTFKEFSEFLNKDILRVARIRQELVRNLPSIQLAALDPILGISSGPLNPTKSDP